MLLEKAYTEWLLTQASINYHTAAGDYTVPTELIYIEVSLLLLSCTSSRNNNTVFLDDIRDLI